MRESDDQAREWGRTAMGLGFVWSGGELTQHGWRVASVFGGCPQAGGDFGQYMRVNDAWFLDGESTDPPWPDFRDGPTRGALVDWVRGLWPDRTLYAFPEDETDGWGVHWVTGGYGHDSAEYIGGWEHPTEVAAWLAAAAAKGAA